ncbi:MAG TPA: hypothetical protein VIJ50_08840 [Solirubrobacteraceae bacterium]
MSAIAPTKGRERQEKILQAIFEVSGHTTRACAYEDIVVQAWKMWPEEFGLRGYVNKYPDSSDLHKPLYGPMKRDGLVRSANKKFSLTPAGRDAAERLRGGVKLGHGRLTRQQKDEVQRIANQKLVELLNDGEDPLDTDLYEFYTVTVRTTPADFEGRITTVDAAIDAALEHNDPSIERERVLAVANARGALRDKFADFIAERSAARERKRK